MALSRRISQARGSEIGSGRGAFDSRPGPLKVPVSLLPMNTLILSNLKNPVVTCLAVVIGTFVAVIVGRIEPVVSLQVAAAELEKPADIVATQIRKQGYKCEKPKSAERDSAASKADGVVWVLRCDSATYRVRLIPKMAAQVERMK